MSTTRNRWLPAAQSVGWFQLNRHDDPEPAAPEPAPDPADDPADPEPEPDPEGSDKLGDEGKRALDRMKADRAAARKAAAAEKKRADELARKVQEFEDSQKSDLDKATAKADRLEAAAKAATARAVKAEVRAAASEFADPEDAAAFLDLATYTSDDGEIDTEAISADLEALLERKPHLRRAVAEPPKKPAPKPDPGQGARPNDPPADFRTASREELEAELANSVPGFRLRA
jgi:hypothetical protein